MFPGRPHSAVAVRRACPKGSIIAGTAFAEKMPNATSGSVAVPILATGSTDMKQARHFENALVAGTREATCIGVLIDDMRRVVELLDHDVATENEHSRNHGYSDTQSSILARTLAARRDNLKATIATLEARVAY
jgi:hypothetical protein